MSEPTIEVRAVTKTYGAADEKVPALQDVSLGLWEGEVVALVGRSGSGKTTLLNVVAGWEEPDAGLVLWKGERVEPSSVEWGRLGIVPQSLGLIEEFTLRENVEYPFRLARRRQAGEVDDLLERLGISSVSHRYPNQTSLGEQQRAAIARALVLEPEAALFDEPTAHLDGARAHAVFEELAEAARRGIACLVATHAPELVAGAARVLMIADGTFQDDA